MGGCGGLHVSQKQEIRAKLFKKGTKHDENSEKARAPHRWTAGHALVWGSAFTTKAATIQGKSKMLVLNPFVVAFGPFFARGCP
jgi:hypothetical protein